MRPRGSSAELEDRRFRATRLLRRGMSVSEVAMAVDASRSSVYRWKQAMAELGTKGLKAKRHNGPKPRITLSQRRDLKKLIRAPERMGYWRWLYANEYVRHIQKRYGVTYHPGHIRRLLRSIGLTGEEIDIAGLHSRPVRRGISR